MKKQITKSGLFQLRQIAVKVHEIINENESDSQWEEKIVPLFSEFVTKVDGVDLLTDQVYIPDPTDEDGFPDIYSGFLQDINSMAIKTVEDVEARILRMADVIDILNGDVTFSIPDSVMGDFNIPTGVTCI